MRRDPILLTYNSRRVDALPARLNPLQAA